MSAPLSPLFRPDTTDGPTLPRRQAGRLMLGLLLGALGCPGCGYNIGAPFSQEVRSVAVSIPKSDSNRRFLENQITEAVQKQIQMRTHFRIAHEDEADTSLVLHFNQLQKGALGQTENSDARELQITLRVTADWVDRRSGEVLRQEGFDLPRMPRQLFAQAEYAPEVGQSLATAETEAVNRLARNIVNMMETPW
ncbi:MAG TPA: hypothetical protein DDY91_03510 [Planctomycetaceae bacterium]|nr:hypothetical protein [Planctomycetaceae bacterium]